MSKPRLLLVLYALGTLAGRVEPAVAGPAARVAAAPVMFFLHLDVTALLKTPFYQRNAGRFKTLWTAGWLPYPKADPPKFLQVTGLDYEKHIGSVSLALQDIEKIGGIEGEWLLEGTLDPAKVRAYLELPASGTTPRPKDGLSAYVQEPQTWFPMTYTIVDDHTLVVTGGSGSIATGAVAAAQGRGPSLESAGTLTEVLPRVEQAQLYCAGIPLDTLRHLLEGTAGQPLTEVRRLDCSMKAGEGLELAVEGLTDTPQQAQELAEGLQWLIGELQTLTAHELPPAASILPAAKITQDGKSARLTIVLPPTEADKLMAILASGFEGRIPATGPDVAGQPAPGPGS